MIHTDAFPMLTADNYRITSSESPKYNCIAWAVGDAEHWWQPGVYWPIETTPDDYGIDALKRIFRELGYSDCHLDAGTEAGFEKIALYVSSIFYTHAARQLPSGKWTSKLGAAEDIEHNSPNDIAGGVYRSLAVIVKRPRPKE